MSAESFLYRVPVLRWTEVEVRAADEQEARGMAIRQSGVLQTLAPTLVPPAPGFGRGQSDGENTGTERVDNG